MTSERALRRKGWIRFQSSRGLSGPSLLKLSKIVCQLLLTISQSRLIGFTISTEIRHEQSLFPSILHRTE